MLTPEQQKEMHADVKEIKEALLGNEYGQKGLVHRVEKNEGYIEKDKKIKWIGVGIGVAIGWFIKLWDKI